ncbi:PEP-CTERM sorting domain-containing protein [Paraglaciecola hydrolytica]|uniref:Ice-binding protein C-terminal domain-containing protein n=1 Tax=Paraglaciecola hydrolytica TaxID=1799789 RepID=A0A136A6V8_9ALTE|nr:PEP-CTERM sorting domain-containing protein [Paraglaciecola hydrolytica]KXI30962.1 hypothetical protein AX660_00410 [Paraglaciecola hydrolytica]
MYSNKFIPTCITIFLTVVTATPVYAGPIISAIGATINAGPGYVDVDNDITNTYNQAGLYSNYQDNITDFDSYIASNPFHTSDYNNNEWFSAHTATSVTYDLGRIVGMNALALWNEESAGIATFNLLGSIDGDNFFSLADGLLPTDNYFDENLPYADYRYLPEVFGFETANVQYVRLDISGCRALKGSYDICSIGEIAFRAVDVPEPSSSIIFGLGLLGLVSRRLRNKAGKKVACSLNALSSIKGQSHVYQY